MKVSTLYILAELPVLLIVIGVSMALFLSGSPTIIWATVFGGACVIWTFSQAIKYTIRSPRPAGSPKGGWAFPSGHATFMFSLSLLSLPVVFWLGIALCALGIISAMARVRMKTHFLSDIVGSALVSTSGIFIINHIIASII